jgi:hypothetical protein
MWTDRQTVMVAANSRFSQFCETRVKVLQFSHIGYCVDAFCTVQNKQRLLSCTTLTDWFL